MATSPLSTLNAMKSATLKLVKNGGQIELLVRDDSGNYFIVAFKQLVSVNGFGEEKLVGYFESDQAALEAIGDPISCYTLDVDYYPTDNDNY